MLGLFWCAMNNRKLLQGIVYFLLSFIAFFLFFRFVIPSAQPILTKKDYRVTKAEKFHYVAIGDSLTEGVGDSTEQGGFVPLLAQGLINEYNYELTYDNYGISGNTSNQILKRMKTKPEIANSLEKANLLTITVGGNDLRKVIIDHITDLEIATFDKPSKAYSKRLMEIISLARKDNPNLPIYVLGVYNPFYLSFPELTDMQTIVDNWNETTRTTLMGHENVYFVPINELLYQGIDGQTGVAEAVIENSETTNNVLYAGDNFHPNNTGYEIMKQAVMEKIDATKNNWNN